VQVQTSQDVLEGGHLLEERGELKRAHQAAGGDLVRPQAGDVSAVEDDEPRVVAGTRSGG